MTVATDTFADFVDHLAEALDDHDATGEELGGAAALLALPPRPDDPSRSAGEPPQRVPPPDPARARGVPDDHDDAPR